MVPLKRNTGFEIRIGTHLVSSNEMVFGL